MVGLASVLGLGCSSVAGEDWVVLLVVGVVVVLGSALAVVVASAVAVRAVASAARVVRALLVVVRWPGVWVFIVLLVSFVVVLGFCPGGGVREAGAVARRGSRVRVWPLVCACRCCRVLLLGACVCPAVLCLFRAVAGGVGVGAVARWGSGVFSGGVWCFCALWWCGAAETGF